MKLTKMKLIVIYIVFIIAISIVLLNLKGFIFNKASGNISIDEQKVITSIEVNDDKKSINTNGKPYIFKEINVHVNNSILNYPKLLMDEKNNSNVNQAIKNNITDLINQINNKLIKSPEGHIELVSTIHYNVSPVISIGFDATFSDKDLAHPVTFSSFITYNVEENKEYVFSDIVRSKEEILSFIKDEILKSNKIKPENAPYPHITKDINEINLDEIQGYYLTPDSLLVSFPRYTLSPMTSIEIEIPFYFLKDEFLSIISTK